MLRVAEHWEGSDTGRQRRANEDSYFGRAPVFVVADGMGGARAGEVASRTAVEQFAPPMTDSGTSPEERLALRLREANARIHKLATGDSALDGMGTTLTAAYVGGDEVVLAHVGDSRAYCLRDGELVRLTDDHSLVGELERQGKLTPEEAEVHPQRSIITRALGPEPDVEVDTRTYRGRPGDVYLLCSDGLTSMISEDQVAEILRANGRLEDAGRALIEAANAAGGRDNITVVLFRLEAVAAVAGPDGGVVDEQPTTVGAQAPRAAEIDAALAAAAADTDPAAAVQAAGRATTAAPPAAAPRRRRPRLPRTAGSRPRRKRRLRRIGPSIAVLAVLTLIVAGAYIALQSVYFIGTNENGLITNSRGLPYDLPAGIHLYSQNFVSGVSAASLSPAERSKLLDHTLRSHDDAADLARKLELGQLAGTR